jgi:membrane-associated phospholipid phosphatase
MRRLPREPLLRWVMPRRNSSAAVLALFIAALVAQSRVESGAHTIPQVLSGALVGFLITTVVFQVFFV